MQENSRFILLKKWPIQSSLWSRCTVKINEPITACPAGGAGSSAQQRSHKVAELFRHYACVQLLALFHNRSRPLIQTLVVDLLHPFRCSDGNQRCVSKMLACTEMITMCLQSAKQKHLRAQQQQKQPMHAAGQGLTIFHDVSGPTLLLISLWSVIRTWTFDTCFVWILTCVSSYQL